MPSEPKKVAVPLDEHVLTIAREAARVVIREHLMNCDARKQYPVLEARLWRLEMKTWKLLGILLGAGLAGGLAGGGVIRLIAGG